MLMSYVTGYFILDSFLTRLMLIRKIYLNTFLFIGIIARYDRDRRLMVTKISRLMRYARRNENKITFLIDN